MKAIKTGIRHSSTLCSSRSMFLLSIRIRYCLLGVIVLVAWTRLLDWSSWIEYDSLLLARMSRSSSNKARPKIAWLLSYPNSGTSYTLQNTQRVTQHNFATTYPEESRYPEFRRSLYKDGFGPYTFHHVRELTIPEHFILTKTHCGGYCSLCSAVHELSPLVSTSVMQELCAVGYRPNNGQAGGPPSLINVNRVIHLIRHPLDNIVSRMHHDSNVYPGRVGGGNSPRKKLQAWCEGTWAVMVGPWTSQMNNTSSNNNNNNNVRWTPFELHKQILNQPLSCGAELYRYIQWHNRIWEMTQSHPSWPVLYVFYENYFSNYNETVHSILTFLRQTAVRDFEPLQGNKSYTKIVYTPEEVQAAAEFVRALALPPVWDFLKRYFPDNQSS